MGDFHFKADSSLTPEDQIVTANPDVTIHDIAEEDEFLVIASDGMLHRIIFCSFISEGLFEGIWECLSSQQVVDFVRLKISEGKELSDVGEMLCDFCLAPDTIPANKCRGCNNILCRDCDDGFNNAVSIGCDNMTVIVVAILNGRTKEEWQNWIIDRVKKNYGYETPRYLPQLYDKNRLAAFNVQQEARQAREERNREEQEKLDRNARV